MTRFIKVTERTYKLWIKKKQRFEEIVGREVTNDELLEAYVE